MEKCIIEILNQFYNLTHTVGFATFSFAMMLGLSVIALLHQPKLNKYFDEEE